MLKILLLQLIEKGFILFAISKYTKNRFETVFLPEKNQD